MMLSKDEKDKTFKKRTHITVAFRMAVRTSSSVSPANGSMDCSVRPNVSWKM